MEDSDQAIEWTCQLDEACSDISPSIIINENPYESMQKQRIRILQGIYNDKEYMTREKKWMLALFFALFALLLCSSYTVGALDSYLNTYGISLFAEQGTSNEVILNVIQFFFLLIGSRYVLSYY
jgi:hypothetical protein